MFKPFATLVLAGVISVCSMAPAEGTDYGADLTAEQLLDSWMGQPNLLQPPPGPKWNLDLGLHAGGGYKENVLFSAFRERDSAFSLAEVDAFLYRESSSPNQFYLYGFADQRHYFDLEEGDDEQMVIAEVSWTRNLSLPGAYNLRGTYSYLDQFFDASISETEGDSLRLFQHEYGIESYLETEILPHLTARLGAGGKQVDLRDLDDDYVRFIALAQARYNRWPRWEAGLTFEHHYDEYDDRPRRAAAGERIDGETVALSTENLTLYAKRYWDAARQWQTHLRLAGRVRNDDGGGYYDYESWRGNLLLRGPVAGCRWEAGLYYGNTDYDVRPSRFGDVASPHLHRDGWRARLRLERDLGPHTSLYTEVSHEDNDSNDPLDVYSQTWAVLGAGYRL